MTLNLAQMIMLNCTNYEETGDFVKVYSSIFMKNGNAINEFIIFMIIKSQK